MADPVFDDDSPDADFVRPPSKSQRKREATALQDLGERLVNLTPTQLKRVPLPEALLDAVVAAQAIPQRGARKRQLQFIGKVMRRLEEAEVAAIQAGLATVATSRR